MSVIFLPHLFRAAVVLRSLTKKTRSGSPPPPHAHAFSPFPVDVRRIFLAMVSSQAPPAWARYL